MLVRYGLIDLYIRLINGASGLTPYVAEQIVGIAAHATLLGSSGRRNRARMTPAAKLLVLLHAEATC